MNMHLLDFTVFICLMRECMESNCNGMGKYFRYSKIKSCSRSSLPTLSQGNVHSVKECKLLAKEKNGLAFNYSPPQAIKHIRHKKNCEILGCPEFLERSTLVDDLAYDYYSAYTYKTTNKNETCIQSVGVFGLVYERNDYLNSIKTCQDLGGDIADVSSEIRTNYLSRFLNNSFQEWNKMVYVGMDDFQVKGTFKTSAGLLLSCTLYRAWAPGHPRKTRRRYSCVTLDSDSMWRVVDYKRKFPVLCEFYPDEPSDNNHI